MDTQALRKRNLRALIKQWDGPTVLAKKLGYSGPSYLSQLVGRHKPITEKTARYIEATLDLPAGWLDQEPQPDRHKVDAALVARVMLTVGRAVEDAGLRLPPARMADVVSFVYECAVERGMDDDFVRRLVKLLGG